MNNIQEDDWGSDSWSRHSGMPMGEELQEKVGAKICPLCGEPNNCQAHTSNRCWCFDTKVPKELLERVAPEQRGKSCVCLACIEKFNTQ